MRRALPLLFPLAACGGGKPIEFPPGLDPFTDAAPACPAGEDTGTIGLESGRTDEYFFAAGCGWAAGPFADVTAAVATPDVGVDRRAVDEWTVEEDVEQGFDVSYAVNTIVHDMVDVEYTLTWRHSLIAEGVWATRWQMTTTNAFVNLIEGSLVATEMEDAENPDGLTKIELIEHIDAIRDSDEERITEFLTDFHTSIVAVAAGEPLPEWSE